MVPSTPEKSQKPPRGVFRRSDMSTVKNLGHRWTSKTAKIASRKRWWKNGKPKPTVETGKKFYGRKS
jgi:hypothetical protein